jgi:hypothetical protein
MTNQSEHAPTQAQKADHQVKVVLGSKRTRDLQIRRFCRSQLIDDDEKHISFKKLIDLLMQVTGIPKEELPKTFCYKDDVGDTVSVSTNRELFNAMAIQQERSSNDKPLKLFSATNNARIGQPTSESSNTGKKKLITDASIVWQIRARMGLTTKSDWNADDKAVLKHLTQSFQDHITSFRNPKFSQKVVSEDHVDHVCAYTIDGKQIESSFFAIDGIYLDMRDHRDEIGRIKVLFPDNKLRTMLAAVSNSKRGFMPEIGAWNELRPVYVHLNQQKPPSLVSFQYHKGAAGPAIEVVNEGPVADLMATSKAHKRVYSILAVFTYSKFKQTGGKEWIPKLTLFALRAFSSHENLSFLTSNACRAATATSPDSTSQCNHHASTKERNSFPLGASGFCFGGMGTSKNIGVHGAGVSNCASSAPLNAFYPSIGAEPCLALGTTKRRGPRRIIRAKKSSSRNIKSPLGAGASTPRNMEEDIDALIAQLQAEHNVPFLIRDSSACPNRFVGKAKARQYGETIPIWGSKMPGATGSTIGADDFRKAIEECSELVQQLQSSNEVTKTEESFDLVNGPSSIITDTRLPNLLSSNPAIGSTSKALRTFEAPKVPFRPTSCKDGDSKVELQTISAMEEYKHDSLEEIRYRDYCTSTLWIASRCLTAPLV